MGGGVIAGVGWDVTIRGILVVLTGVGVLIGSVWLLLSTNMGTRVGTLLTFTGFFGWMFIMGITWWMFGIGWKGDPPSWKALDINYNELPSSPVKVAERLTEPTTLPRAYDLVVQSNDEAAKKEFASDIPADRLEGLDAAAQAKARADWDVRNKSTTLSELAAVAPELTKNLDYGKGWKLLSTAQSGEAAATASAQLVAHGDFSASTEFKVLNAYELGGKPKLPDNPNRWDRITHELGSMIKFRHPPRYAVVQVQKVIAQPTVAGEAPPRPVVDPSQPIVSVIMERDLGSLRLHSALITIGSLLLFIVSATMLHYRDKESMARRAALAGTR
ncbi:MAG TPA: hypothetical protein VGQ20_11375 [Acidimicrobiales bacterium]|jgi:hypothetical protein|nr:hypothetical protein [Acidimicrobiales bacterium]